VVAFFLLKLYNQFENQTSDICDILLLLLHSVRVQTAFEN